MKEGNAKEPKRENIKVTLFFFLPVYADRQENYSSNCRLLFTKDRMTLGS